MQRSMVQIHAEAFVFLMFKGIQLLFGQRCARETRAADVTAFIAVVAFGLASASEGKIYTLQPPVFFYARMTTQQLVPQHSARFQSNSCFKTVV